VTSSAVLGSRLVVDGPDAFGATRAEQTAPAFLALTAALAGERPLAARLTGYLALGAGVRGYVGASDRLCLGYVPSTCGAAMRFADRPAGLTTVGLLGARRTLGRTALSVEVGDHLGRERGSWRHTVVTWLGLALP
jgi:hypothetical protein